MTSKFAVNKGVAVLELSKELTGELKEKIYKLFESGVINQSKIARDLKIPRSTIRYWYSEFRKLNKKDNKNNTENSSNIKDEWLDTLNTCEVKAVEAINKGIPSHVAPSLLSFVAKERRTIREEEEKRNTNKTLNLLDLNNPEDKAIYEEIKEVLKKHGR